MRFQGGLQLGQNFGARLAISLGLGLALSLTLSDLFFQGLQHFGDGLVGLFPQRLALGRIHFGFGRLGFFGGFATPCPRSSRSTPCTHNAGSLRAGRRLRLNHGFAPQAANLVGPHRHRGQCQCGIGLRQLGGGQGR